MIEGTGSPYGGSPAVPGSIFYTHSVSVSAAHSAASGGYQLPPGSMYSYPTHSSSSRPTYSVQTPVSSKDDASSAPKHHSAVYVGQGNVLPQNPQRSKGWFPIFLDSNLGKNIKDGKQRNKKGRSANLLCLSN